MKNKILKEFDNSKGTLVDLKVKMTGLLFDLIKEDGIQIHQLNGRLKERASIEGKIDRKQDKYASLEDITDVVGVRIITYLESDVDRVADLIIREFDIDSNNSIDKRKLKSNQFGYRSLHYVVSCKKERVKLVEYKKFENKKFEIQVRSILQHAWAEIEHDLGYKGIISIPEDYKRSFNRLAALLESADLEFDRLKKELSIYEAEVNDLIEKEPESVSINQASLISFVQNNQTIIKAQEIVKRNVGCTFSNNTDYKDSIERFNNYFGINNILELHMLIETNKELFLEFINEFTKDFSYRKLTGTIIIFYLQHFLAAKDEDNKYLEEYYKINRIGGDRNMIEIIRKAKQTIANRVE
jgi:putative GTP pyrophosphokinase